MFSWLKCLVDFGVNNLLQNRNRSFEVSKVIISGIVFSKRVARPFVDEVNSKITSMCKHNSFGYIYYGNISNIHLFDDSLHLLSQVCIYLLIILFEN